VRTSAWATSRYCIGAPLARIELQTVFSQLIPRFPGMRWPRESKSSRSTPACSPVAWPDFQ